MNCFRVAADCFGLAEVSVGVGGEWEKVLEELLAGVRVSVRAQRLWFLFTRYIKTVQQNRK